MSYEQQNAEALRLVLQFVDESIEMMTNVFRGSVEELATTLLTPVHLGGLMPFRTGNLLRSFWLSTSGFAMTASNQHKFEGMQDYVTMAQSLELGDTAYLSLRAAYAKRRNYGFTGEDSLGRFYNDEGYGFVEQAAYQWPAIVDRQVRKYRVNG